MIDDLAAIEAVEVGLSELINRRSASQEEATREEEEWKESARKHNAKKREQNREAWRCFYLAQAERLERTAAELAASHRAKAAALLNGEGAQTCRG